jgi:pyruvate formate lyase activating enzyme
MQKEALYYEKLDKQRVGCRLCPHNCTIAEGKVGICGVRRNLEGSLHTLIYGEVSSMAMDPIEKKPLYHFFPGSSILSIGTVGCSFRCRFCQNYNISQNPDYPTRYYTPGEIVNYALSRGSVGVAYTYSEPLIWFEYVLDVCRATRESGLKNVFVTNGYINKEPLLEILKYADAFNIDLKSFSEDFYRRIIGGKVKHVLETIEEISLHRAVMLELTTLIIPGYNDSDEEMEEITAFIASLPGEVPYHLSAYYPMHHFSVPSTPLKTLERLKEIALKKLKYVYLGNVAADSSTYCPSCGSPLIERHGYSTEVLNLHNGECAVCGARIPVVLESSG